MPLAIPRKTIELFSSTAPERLKETIQSVVAPKLHSVQVKYNMVLVAVYFRPQVTAGGIIRPDANVEEDMWQSKVGLVLKMGPKAYVDDEYNRFEEEDKVAVGDWCGFRIGDSWQLQVNDVPCRLVEDSHIRLGLSDPSVVF